MTPKTLFYGASTSKAFTAAALSIMIASGNYTVPSLPGSPTPLAWTTPIAALIPDDFVLLDEPWATTHLTLEDALSHRTGLPRHDNSNAHRLADRTATPRDVVRALRYLPLNAAPRTKWQYCNQMFVVAAHVIQTLTGGVWLGDTLRAWIWAPLGMDATYFSLEDALAAPEHFARGYSWLRGEGGEGGEGGEFVPIPYMPTDEVSGAGAVVSCVDDYVKWIRMWLREEGPVPRQGQAAIKTPRMFSEPETVLESYGNATAKKKLPYDAPLGYSFGWWVGSYRGQAFWTHSGGMHAFGAEVFFFPGLDFGVVTFANTAVTSNFVGLFAVWQLVDDRLGVPEEERFDWEGEYVLLSSAPGVVEVQNWIAKLRGNRYQGFNEKRDANMVNAIAKTYPNRPSTPIAPALVLSAYEGTYYHPAYMNYTLKLAADATTLVANRSGATWSTINEFKHVSGEYWMMYQRYPYGDRNGPNTDYAPVEFRVGPEGRVDEMVVTFLETKTDEADTVEGVITFDKIE